MPEVVIINGLKITITRNSVPSKKDAVDAFIKLIERKKKEMEESSNATNDG